MADKPGNARKLAEVQIGQGSDLERFAEPGERGFVFVGPKGGQLRRSNFHKSVWIKAREKLGLPDLHFHDYADVCVMPTWAGESLAAGLPACFMSA
jgi:hypothetical protein